MNTLKWHLVNRELDKVYKKIFKNININSLDYYTKRKMIFEYLCTNIQYDYDLLEKIKLKNEKSDYILKRDHYLEIESVLKNSKGVCNAISQIYKLLLEKVGIYCMCVICDDGTNIKHQLNLVYDEESDSFSFDDITSVIVNRGNSNLYFDYDMEDANNYNQGLRPIFKNINWAYLPTGYIYSIVEKKSSTLLQSNIEDSNPFSIPENIVSLKKRNAQKKR